MDDLEALHTPEVARFSGYLEALGYCVIGADYVTHFEAVAFELSEQAFAPECLIKAAYPESNPDTGEIVESSSHQMIERVNYAFELPDPPYSDIDFREEIQANLIAAYWRHLKACIDYEDATILEYIPSQSADDELWDFIHWGFTFLMYSKKQRRCLIVHGGASD